MLKINTFLCHNNDADVVIINVALKFSMYSINKKNIKITNSTIVFWQGPQIPHQFFLTKQWQLHLLL